MKGPELQRARVNEIKGALSQVAENLGDAQVSIHNGANDRAVFCLQEVIKQATDTLKYIKRLK